MKEKAWFQVELCLNSEKFSAEWLPSVYNYAPDYHFDSNHFDSNQNDRLNSILINLSSQAEISPSP